MAVKPTFFVKPSAFRKWLEKNHAQKNELLVGFYKVDSGKPSMTWSESVDEALCFGWIDGVRKSIDETAYCIRFTPRKASSIWSSVNIKKMEALIRFGKMHPSGLASFDKRQQHKSGVYAHEKQEVELPGSFQKLFQKNKKAWTYFQSLAPSYQKSSINWVMSAKQPATQLKRMQQLIAESQAGTNQFKENKYNRK